MLFLKPDVTKKKQRIVFLKGFVWSHQRITGLIPRRQFVPKCYFLASRPLGCCSFQNILTNPIISQINTLLLPYLISYYSSAFTITSSTTTTPKCTLRRVLFLYNLLCMTHHIIFVNSVSENYKSGVDFAQGRHFGESHPNKLKSLFSRNKQRSTQLHLKLSPIGNTHRSINHRK